MTLAELYEFIEELELEMGEDLDPDTEIRFAHQPRWAFEYSINNAGLTEVEGKKVLYLAEGGQLGYLPEAARVAIDWIWD